MNLPLIASSSMNPLIQTSNHSPKNSDRDVHQVGLILIKLGSESLPFCFLELRPDNNPKAPQNAKQKNIKSSSLDR